MPSQIELAIRAFRAAVLRQEQAATRTLITAYQPARERLIQRIDELVTALQEAGMLTPSELARFERAVALSEQVEAEVTRLAQIANQVIPETQGRMVALAGQHTRALALASVPASDVASIAAAWNRVPTTAVEALVGRLSNGSPLSTLLGKLPAETSTAIQEALKEGVALGRNPRATAALLEKQVDVSSVRLLAISRTETLNAYRSATLANYAAQDVLDGWFWIAALDGSCAACAAMHGSHHLLSEDFFPAHTNCRCSACPSVRGVESPITQSGAEWFAGKDADYQDKVLGVSGGQSYRSGKVALDDFVHVRTSEQWGDSVTQGSLTRALEMAERRAA